MKRNTIIGTISAAFLATVALASCGPTAKTYHVKFTSENKLVEEKDYKENEIIVAPEDPTPYEKDHKMYTFEAWYDGESKFEPGVTKATKDVEYIAKFNGVDMTYTVTFMNEGQEYKKITDAKYRDKIVKPDTNPEHSKDKKYTYTFDDWYYKDTDTKLGEGDIVEGNTVLEARYNTVAIKYDVTFKKGGEQDVVKQFSADNLSVTAPTFTPTKHKAGIWNETDEHQAGKTADSGAEITFTEDELDDWEFTYVETNIDYTITFKKTGESDVTETVNLDSLELTAPKFDATKHYDGEWYCAELGTGVSLGSEGTYTFTTDTLGSYTFVYKEEAHEYNVTFKKNGQADIVKTITVLDGADTAPTFTAADYRTGKWVSSDPAKELDSGESFDFTGNDLHDWTFNYNEVDTDYTITFKKTGEQDVTATVNLSNLTFTAPTFTPTEHYDGAWVCEPWTTQGTSLSLGSGASHLLNVQSGELGDHTFVYGEEAIEYDVKFVEPDGSTVVDTQQISAESLVIEETPGHEPTDHYDGVWKEDATEVEPGDPITFAEQDLKEHTFTWTKTQTPHVYTITFVYEDGETQSVEREATIESPQITAPATKATQSGYTYKWVCDDFTMESEGTKTFTTDDLGDYTLVETAVGNEYTVTLNANGGTIDGDTSVSVTFGEEYELEIPTYDSLSDFEFDGWYDTDTNEKVASTGIWSIPSDTTLIARWKITFDNYEVGATSVDSFVDATKCTYAVFEDSETGEKGIKITPTQFDCGVKLKADYLSGMFADEDVTAVTFMARSDARSNNFRYRTDKGSGPSNYTYESGNQNFGLHTRWKTFTYTRDAYSTFDSSTDYMFWAGTGTIATPTYIDIKRIQPVTYDLIEEEKTSYHSTGFEGGWNRGIDDPANPIYYAPHSNNDGDLNTLKIFDYGIANNTPFMSYDIVKTGNRSLGITRAAKATDWSSFCLYGVDTTTHQYSVSFDFYTEIDLNSHPDTKILGDGNGNPFGSEIGWHFEAGKWTHIELDNTKLSSATSRVCFLKFFGSASLPEFHYYLDNLIVKQLS